MHGPMKVRYIMCSVRTVRPDMQRIVVVVNACWSVS